jgi:putative oxidoreductase
MRKFPFLSLQTSLIIMRVATAIFFLAHAVVRLVNGTIPGFGQFLDARGIPFGLAVVWAITAQEIIGGVLLALGWQVRWLTIGFQAICWGGIVIIHAKLGWFVGEHGTGGVEYSLCLSVALLVLAAADREGFLVANKK